MAFRLFANTFSKLSLADDSKERAQQPPLEVLAFAHNHDVNVGRPIGLPR
jgi:hypothetical protein